MHTHTLLCADAGPQEEGGIIGKGSSDCFILAVGIIITCITAGEIKVERTNKSI